MTTSYSKGTPALPKVEISTPVAPTPKSKESIPFFVNFLMSGSAATLSKTCTAPMERIKLILQSQDSHPNIKANPELRYTGIINALQRISTEDGVAALWRGNLANVMRYVPQQAFNFAFKDTFAKYFTPTVDKTNFYSVMLGNFASGGAAAACSSVIIYP